MSKFYGTADQLDAAILSGTSDLLLPPQTVGPVEAPWLRPLTVLAPIDVTCATCGADLLVASAWTTVICAHCNALIALAPEVSSHV